MKKLLMLILSLAMATAALTSCGLFDIAEESSSPSASSIETPIEKTYKVTFKQMGEEDVIKEVKEGESLAGNDIPAPKAKTGYTVTWKAADLEKLTNINANVVVEAVLEANTYTITYDAQGGSCPSTQKVVYDSDIVLATPELAGNKFICWLDADGKTVSNGKWTVASDVTLTAKWEEVKVETVTVTFVQAGQEPITRTIEKGTACTDIPEVKSKTGYTIKWNEEELAKLASVTGNVTVNAVETANKYKVTFVDAKNVVTQEVEVTYDAAYDLTPASAPTGYHFDYFTKGGEKFAASNTEWKIANDVELTVVWAGNTYTVKLNANEGTCSAATIDVIYGESYTLPTPTKEGYIFEGWYQDSTKVELTGTWSLTGASIELKAKWRNEEWTKNY